MPRVNFLMCAQAAAVDRYSNTLSVFELLEELTPSGYPGWLPKMLVIAMLTREDGDPDQIAAEIVITIGTNEILRKPVNADFQGKMKNRLLLTLHGLPLPAPGELTVCLRLGGQDAAEYSIVLNPPAQLKADAVTAATLAE